jgi:hypothetical protein
MNSRLASLVVLSVFAGQSPSLGQQWGDLVGKVVIRFQQPPAIQPITVGPNQQIADESLLVAKDGGVANVLIYLRTPSVPVHPDLAATVLPHAIFTFKDSMVRPRVLPVWIGRQTVLFGNLDPVAYNPNVQPLGDVPANFLLRAGGAESYTPSRQQSIPVSIGCNIKPWIRAYMLPRYNPYAAVTDEKGEFKLSKLPAGALEFQLWHEKYGFLDTLQQPKGRFTLTIKPGENDLGTIVVQR